MNSSGKRRTHAQPQTQVVSLARNGHPNDSAISLTRE
jgi:hypothetical protein